MRTDKSQLVSKFVGRTRVYVLASISFEKLKKTNFIEPLETNNIIIKNMYPRIGHKGLKRPKLFQILKIKKNKKNIIIKRVDLRILYIVTKRPNPLQTLKNISNYVNKIIL